MKRPLTFLCICFFFLTGKAQEGNVSDSIELNALRKFYESTNGDLWFDNSGWLSESHFSLWNGVTVTNGDVTGINLAFNDLSGSLPPELYELAELEDLILEYNELEGKLDPRIANLTKLKYLYLRYNSLSGNIPASIGNLSNLEVLDLFYNNLDGSIPSSIGSLTNLYELSLAYNSFSGTIPVQVGDLQNIEVINLGDNLFAGEIPKALGNLPYLYDLLLDYNLLEGPIPSTFANLQSLEYLGVAYNQLTGALPQFFTLLPIRGFWVYGNLFSSMPDFSDHPDPESIIIDVRENRLDFGDLEPNWTSTGTIFNYPSYSPQDSLDTYFNAKDFTYFVEVGGQFNQYQWLKNGTEMPGATTPTLVLNQAEYSNSDRYQCRITNSRITGLTLWSRSKSIRPGQYYAIADGNWNDQIWSREKDGLVAEDVPGEGSEVFIIGRNVALTSDRTTGPVHVVVENAGASLVVDGAEMTVVGTLDLTKETEGYPGDVKVINGGRIVPVEK